MNSFDFINSIHFNKDYLFNDPEVAKEYNQFLVNKALSYFPENIFYVNEMNKNCNINKKMQYDFYFYVISKRKRYINWDKRDNDIDININAIKEYYKYSTRKAVEALSLLNSEQLQYIKDKLNKGGKDE